MIKPSGLKVWLTSCLLVWCSASLADEQRWYFVRHFEKLTGQDPGLTIKGHRRAQALADYFAQIPLTKIYSTDYQRTIQSVQPLAESQGLDIEYYDANQLADFAKHLTTFDRVLVVGHSNTTPQLVRLMGGVAEDMGEQDYGRLFILNSHKIDINTQILNIPFAP